jgi:hypothetical protein
MPTPSEEELQDKSASLNGLCKHLQKLKTKDKILKLVSQEDFLRAVYLNCSEAEKEVCKNIVAEKDPYIEHHKVYSESVLRKPKGTMVVRQKHQQFKRKK